MLTKYHLIALLSLLVSCNITYSKNLTRHTKRIVSQIYKKLGEELFIIEKYQSTTNMIEKDRLIKSFKELITTKLSSDFPFDKEKYRINKAYKACKYRIEKIKDKLAKKLTENKKTARRVRSIVILEKIAIDLEILKGKNFLTKDFIYYES